MGIGMLHADGNVTLLAHAALAAAAKVHRRARVVVAACDLSVVVLPPEVVPLAPYVHIFAGPRSPTSATATPRQCGEATTMAMLTSAPHLDMAVIVAADTVEQVAPVETAWRKLKCGGVLLVVAPGRGASCGLPPATTEPAAHEWQACFRSEAGACVWRARKQVTTQWSSSPAHAINGAALGLSLCSAVPNTHSEGGCTAPTPASRMLQVSFTDRFRDWYLLWHPHGDLTRFRAHCNHKYDCSLCVWLVLTARAFLSDELTMLLG